MKKLLFALLLIPAMSLGQTVVVPYSELYYRALAIHLSRIQKEYLSNHTHCSIHVKGPDNYLVPPQIGIFTISELPKIKDRFVHFVIKIDPIIAVHDTLQIGVGNFQVRRIKRKLYWDNDMFGTLVKFTYNARKQSYDIVTN